MNRRFLRTRNTADPGADDREPSVERGSRRRKPTFRRILVWSAMFTAGAIVGSTLFAGGAPIGYFRSAQGQLDYLTAYEEALANGPALATRLTVETDYGVAQLVSYQPESGAAEGADPLVLLPGTQSGAPMWADNIPTLAAERPVYVVDLLGQPGRSIQSRPIESHRDDARWLAQVLESLPGDPILMGHSLGGWLAMNLAVHEPDAASRVILLDPVLTFGGLSAAAVLRSVPASVPWLPRGWRQHFASWTANDAPIQEEPVAEMIEAGMQHYSLGTPGPTRFSDEDLSDVTLPVLVIMAGKSRMHDSTSAARVAERVLAEGTVLVYDNASHAINGEEPARIARDVSRFVEEN